MNLTTSQKDILLSTAIGVLGLLFFHLDHLVVTYSGWDDPDWLLHLVVDGSYVLVYGFLGWVVLRGWRLWQQRNKENER